MGEVTVNIKKVPDVRLTVTMPDGSKWEVRGDTIARDRATYFSEKERDPSKRLQIWYDEYDYTLAHADELIDWSSNNMSWHDVAKWARQVSPSPIVDYESGWTNGTKEVTYK